MQGFCRNWKVRPFSGRSILRKKAVAAVALLSLLAPAATALGKDTKDESERAQKAAEVLGDIMKTPDKGIPRDLLDQAHAIAVIPHVVKGAFGFGGRWGKGLIAKRTGKGGWGTPSFIDIGGASVGFQIGVSATDLILIFTDETTLQSLLANRVKIGADASAVAGPVGRTAEAGVTGNLKSAIYSYSRSKGLFAGISLDGAALTIDDDSNHAVYGANVSSRDIFNGTVAANAVVKPFVDELRRVAPKVVK
ncbi:MAG TPA: lipid-binding SYLF domain-containing protein [Acidobacteriota bacterium]